MPANKQTRIFLSSEAREACKQKIAEQNPSLEQGIFVYAPGGIPIAMAIGNNQFQYLGPLAEKNNKSSESNLRTLLFHLGIIDSESASIEDLIVLDQQPSVAASKTPPPAESIVISGIQKDSEGFCFLPEDAEAIKNAIEKKRRAGENISQRYLLETPDTGYFVGFALNSKPVHLFDFIKILNALIEKNLVTLKKGTTIETLLELPEVDENNPLELLKEDIHFKGNKIFLSETAINEINARIFKKNLAIETLVSQSDVSEPYLKRFLKGTLVPKDSFLNLLNLLVDQGVLKKPETSFEALLVYDLVPDNFMITRPINGETRILLKQDPANAIQARLVANRLTQVSIAEEACFKNDLMVNNLLCNQTIDPENLKKILRVLLNHQIITLPEGSNVDDFVDLVCAQSPSYPKTSAGRAASTTANCMASNGTQPAAMVVVSLSENGVATR